MGMIAAVTLVLGGVIWGPVGFCVVGMTWCAAGIVLITTLLCHLGRTQVFNPDADTY